MKFGDAKVIPFISISADSKFADAPATRDAIARRRDARPSDALIGGQGYSVDFAGAGTAEMYWDALVAEARLLQLPDLLGGEWVNSGGHYDRKKAEWFNTEGAVGIPIAILRDVVLGRIIELGLSKEILDKYVTRNGRTVAEEEAFLGMDVEARVKAIRGGEAL
jgi:hypothetical protein